jgi:Skp family chaperone for outer membrane proteins
MRSRAAILAVLGAVLAGIWLTMPGVAQQPAPASRSPVAVVNIPQVFRHSREIQSLNESFKARADQMSKDIESQSRIIVDRENEIKVRFSSDGRDYKDRMQTVLSERIGLRISTEEKQAEMLRVHQRRTEEFYAKVMGVVQSLAQSEGYDLILYREDYEVKNARDPEELLEMIRQRKVLYESARADITKRVLDKLDADFAASAK